MNPHLIQFSRQLTLWTQDIIDHGQTPFRRVEHMARIETAAGVVTPALIFWINRQSVMAGGIVFLPDNNLEEVLKQGQLCATSLGLRHFVTWESAHVRIWQVTTSGVAEHQSFSLGDPADPESFRDLLGEILEALKLLAVLGAIPPAELSHWYLCNLFQMTLQQTRPALVEAYRSQRSERDEFSPEDADGCADEAGRLLLLQVLALLWFDRFPDAILPEKMERAIELSLPDLDEELRQPLLLKTSLNPPSLPFDAAVSFHHLLLRLRQLAWRENPERSAQAVFSLQQAWYRNAQKDDNDAPIQLYPAAPPATDTTKVILSDSPSLLALTALIAAIRHQPTAQLICNTIFSLDKTLLPPAAIAARLLNRSGIPSSKRHEFSARLRAAWPHRRLKIKTGQPHWSWELTHLLGICHTGQHSTIRLPAEIVTTERFLPVWTLLWENSSLLSVAENDDSTLRLTLLHHQESDRPLIVETAAGQKEIERNDNPVRMRTLLLCALNLPASIYKLLGNELVWPDKDEVSSGVEIYRQSAIYRRFQTFLDTDIPQPDTLLSNELDQFVSAGGSTDDLDLFLAKLLDCPAAAVTVERQGPVVTEKAGTTAVSHRKLTEELIQQLKTRGIPDFPEQYLYFLDRPEICRYTFEPPLKLQSSLLGQFEFHDRHGRVIDGYGPELEQILQLCSDSGKGSFDLPADPHQLEQILELYRKDLSALYKYLQNLCYGQIGNSKNARQTVRRIWKKLNLPDPASFKVSL